MGPIRVEVEGGACGDDYGPALDSYVASMDADQSSTINSDEFNTAFQEADDDVDGKLDLDELRNAVCGGGTTGGG
jgi:Ca2+-binding EF-hand superfamily protein